MCKYCEAEEKFPSLEDLRRRYVWLLTGEKKYIFNHNVYVKDWIIIFKYYNLLCKITLFLCTLVAEGPRV
jgi:hypothetical protein